ncbi:MAG: hypothetical protein AAGF57_20865, partial [Pseudomonadota bacterium]
MQHRFAVLALLCAPLVMSCSGGSSSPEPVPVAPAPPSPPPAPTPPSATVFDVPKSAWLIFSEGDDIPTDLVNDVSLTCDDQNIPAAVIVLSDGRVVINPAALLPEGGLCT